MQKVILQISCIYLTAYRNFCKRYKPNGAPCYKICKYIVQYAHLINMTSTYKS